jgi:ribosomal protein S27AE
MGEFTFAPSPLPHFGQEYRFELDFHRKKFELCSKTFSASFMGRTYLFECFRCGYRAWVSGGAGAGEHFAVQTIVCADCKELYDAVTEFKATMFPMAGGINKTAPGFAAVLNRLPPRGARPRLIFKPACPVSPLHHVRAWNRPDKCPKCGTFMEQDGLPFRLWD